MSSKDDRVKQYLKSELKAWSWIALAVLVVVVPGLFLVHLPYMACVAIGTGSAFATFAATRWIIAKRM